MKKRTKKHKFAIYIFDVVNICCNKSNKYTCKYYRAGKFKAYNIIYRSKSITREPAEVIRQHSTNFNHNIARILLGSK